MTTIDGMLAEQNKEILKAYKDLRKAGGNFWELVDKSKPNLDSYTNRYEYNDSSYSTAVKELAFRVGYSLHQLEKIAQDIKTNETSFESLYWNNWQFCATAVPDHPDMPIKRKFCEDYRKNEPVEKHIHYYKVGDNVVSNHLKGYFAGKVIAIEDDGMLHIEMTPNNKRFKKKIVFCEADSLDFFPADGKRRKEK